VNDDVFGACLVPGFRQGTGTFGKEYIRMPVSVINVLKISLCGISIGVSIFILSWICSGIQKLRLAASGWGLSHLPGTRRRLAAIYGPYLNAMP
jgi:hypothetical protein